MNRKTKKALTLMTAILVILIIVIIILAATDKKEIPDEQMGTTIIGEMAEAVANGEPLTEAEPETVQSLEPTTVDLPNEKEVRLYVDNSGVMELVREYNSSWSPDYDIAIFEAINSEEENIHYDNYFTLHEMYWDAQATALTYKIGYELSFDLNGERKVYTILSPSDILDNDDLFMGDAVNDVVTGHMGVWVYYDMHQTGTYVHLMPEDMTEDVLMTSIKLRPTPLSGEISNFKLKAFSYSSEQEFNSRGQYIGTHGYEISVNNQ